MIYFLCISVKMLQLNGWIRFISLFRQSAFSTKRSAGKFSTDLKNCRPLAPKRGWQTRERDGEKRV